MVGLGLVAQDGYCCQATEAGAGNCFPPYAHGRSWAGQLGVGDGCIVLASPPPPATWQGDRSPCSPRSISSCQVYLHLAPFPSVLGLHFLVIERCR